MPKKIDCPRYNMKCSVENIIQRGIFPVVSCFPLHFMLYRGNLVYFSDSVCTLNKFTGATYKPIKWKVLEHLKFVKHRNISPFRA